MSDLTSVAFWKATAERAVKTVAQSEVVLLGAINTLDVFKGVPWQDTIGVSLGAGLLSALTSVASAQITSTPGPSLTKAEQLVPPPGP